MSCLHSVGGDAARVKWIVAGTHSKNCKLLNQDRRDTRQAFPELSGAPQRQGCRALLRSSGRLEDMPGMQDRAGLREEGCHRAPLSWRAPCGKSPPLCPLGPRVAVMGGDV